MPIHSIKEIRASGEDYTKCGRTALDKLNKGEIDLHTVIVLYVIS